MSKMATTPVFACRGCGKAVYASLQSFNDPNNEKLKSMMQNLQKIALCKYCQMKLNWLATQGRADEFSTNPHAVIYNVVDNSQVDYYGKKEQ